MEIVEEIKDEGMNDKRYMDIMNQLMILHKEDEKEEEEEPVINYNDIIYNYDNRIRNTLINNPMVSDNHTNIASLRNDIWNRMNIYQNNTA